MNKLHFSNKLISFNKHNSSIKIPDIINDLKKENYSTCEHAGLPGICDPGEDIAKSVKSEGLDIIYP